MLPSFPHALGEPSAPLPAAATLHYHVLVVLQHNSVFRVQIEQGDGAEGGGDAACPGHCSIHGVDQSLHHSVAGGVHVVSQWEATLAQAEEGVVAARRNDPFVPAHVVEIHVQRVAAAPVAGKSFQLCGAPAVPFHSGALVPTVPSFVPPPACLGVPCFFGPTPKMVSLAALAALPALPFLSQFSIFNPLATNGGPPAMFDQGLPSSVVTVGHQQGSLLGPAVFILTQRPTHSQVSLLVFLQILLTCSSRRALIQVCGAVLWSDLQKEAEGASPCQGFMQELCV